MRVSAHFALPRSMNLPAEHKVLAVLTLTLSLDYLAATSDSLILSNRRKFDSMPFEDISIRIEEYNRRLLHKYSYYRILFMFNKSRFFEKRGLLSDQSYCGRCIRIHRC